MYFKGTFLSVLMTIAGTQLIEGQELCHKAAPNLPCCTCTRQPAIVMCQSACPSGYFVAADLAPPCEPPTSNIVPPRHHNNTSAVTEPTTSDDQLSTTSGSNQTVTKTDDLTTTMDKKVSSLITEMIQPTRNIKCIPCDVACSHCTGYGPHNCTKCADDYEREKNNEGTCVNKSLNIALIAGCSAGAVVVVLVVVLVSCCWNRRRKAALQRNEYLNMHVSKRSDEEDGNKTDDVQVPTNEDAVPEPKDNRRYARKSLIEIAYDKMMRYVRDPTAKVRRKSTRVSGEHSEEGIRHGGPENRHTVTDEIEGPYATIDPSFTGISPDQQVSEVNECSQSEEHNHSKNSKSTPDQNPADNAGSIKGHYKNAYQLDQSSTSRDPKASTSNRPTEGETTLHDSVGNQGICNDAESQRDSGFESARVSGADSVKEHVYENCLVTPVYQNFKSDFQNSQTKRPVFSQSWQFSGTFASPGGRLQGEQSSVCLQIPEGAIDEAKSEKIQGAVCTKLDEVHNKLKLPADDCIVSPVIEYEAHSGASFQTRKPMEIALPHSLHPSFSGTYFKVYRFQTDSSGTFDVKQLPFVDKQVQESTDQGLRNDTGVYYFNENNQIIIMTSYFCGYLCTYCKKEYPPSDLYLEVFAKQVKEEEETVAEVRLYIWDSKFGIKDFTQNLPDQDCVNAADMKRIDSKTLSALSKDDDLSKIWIGAQLEMRRKEDERFWKHSVRQDGTLVNPPQTTIEMKSFVPCTCHHPVIPQRVDWELTATGLRESFRCLVDVGYVSTSDLRSQGRLCFLRQPKSQNIKVCLTIKTSQTDGRGQNAHPARITEMVPSTQPLRELIAPLTSSQTDSSHVRDPRPEGAEGGFPSLCPPRSEDSHTFIHTANTVNMYNQPAAPPSFDRGPTSGAWMTPASRPDMAGYRQPAAVPGGQANPEAHIYCNFSEPPAPVNESGDGRDLGQELG